jgi:type I restriction enzyme R subunit
VEYPGEGGRVIGDKVWLLDFAKPENNDWLAVNQFAVVEDPSSRGYAGVNRHNRRPDVVIFVNGLPLVVIELKNATDENATIWSAFQQLQTYKLQIPSLLAYNALLIISDGLQARVGSLTADRERFMPWRTTDGKEVAPLNVPQLHVLLAGLLDKRRFWNMCAISRVLKTATGRWLRRSPVITNSTRSCRPCRRRFRHPDRKATGAAVWSGTLRDPARA